MANPRQEDKPARNPEDTMQRAADYTAAQAGQIGQATAEQTSRLGKAAADKGEEVARIGAELLQHNAETLQNTWRLGLETASAIMGRSTDQLGRTLGLAGDGAQKATERSARNYETILYATTSASNLIDGMSREYFGLVRRQMEKTMELMSDLWSCRTPQDVAAAQSELARESVGTLLESSRRLADMSLRSVEDAAKHMSENMERKRAAA